MLKIQSDRVIIDGHEPTKEQCETMTLLANALAESNNFKTVEYRDGYAEFEKVGKADELKFAEEGTEIVVNSTTLETTLHTAGKYCDKNILVKSSDSNLIAENIKKDVSVFGVTGSYAGTDVSDTTATQGDVLSGKYFYGSDGVKTEGTIPVHTETSITLNAGTGDQYVPNGFYSDILTKLVLNSDAASKIKQGEVILGVTGSYAGSGGVALNIAYGDTAPTDTSKLWIKDSEPTNIKFTPSSGAETMNSDIASLPTAASSIASAAVGTKIYLFGGRDGSGNLSTINVFDTTSNTITTLSTTLSTATYGIASAAVGTKIYLFGGNGSSVFSTINVFDTATNTRTLLSATLPTAAHSIASAAVGTKIYLFGGSGRSNLSTINVFDTTSSTITTLSTTLPTGAYAIASAAVGTKIYLFGGRDGSGPLSTINVFDTTNNTITTLSTTLPTAANGITCAAVGTKIYLFGGYGSSLFSTINVFDTTTDTITTLSTTLPTATYNIASAAVGTKIYLFGGYGSSYLNTINQFVVSVDLTSGNILVVTNTVDLFNLISTDAVSLEVGIANIYKGNTDNQAELCDAYLHDGTNWVNVNTGEIYAEQLSTPQNVTAAGTTVSWDAVENATSYEILVNGSSFGTVSTTSVDLSTLSGWASLTDGEYSVTIVAKADGYADSEPSAAVSVEKAAPGGYTVSITYTNIQNVDGVVTINGGSPIRLDQYGTHTVQYSDVQTLELHSYLGMNVLSATGSLVGYQDWTTVNITQDSSIEVEFID